MSFKREDYTGGREINPDQKLEGRALPSDLTTEEVNATIDSQMRSLRGVWDSDAHNAAITLTLIAQEKPEHLQTILHKLMPSFLNREDLNFTQLNTLTYMGVRLSTVYGKDSWEEASGAFAILTNHPERMDALQFLIQSLDVTQLNDIERFGGIGALTNRLPFVASGADGDSYERLKARSFFLGEFSTPPVERLLNDQELLPAAVLLGAVCILEPQFGPHICQQIERRFRFMISHVQEGPAHQKVANRISPEEIDVDMIALEQAVRVVSKVDPENGSYLTQRFLHYSEHTHGSRARYIGGILKTLADSKPGGESEICGWFDSELRDDITMLIEGGPLVDNFNARCAKVRGNVLVFSDFISRDPTTVERYLPRLMARFQAAVSSVNSQVVHRGFIHGFVDIASTTPTNLEITMKEGLPYFMLDGLRESNWVGTNPVKRESVWYGIAALLSRAMGADESHSLLRQILKYTDQLPDSEREALPQLFHDSLARFPGKNLPFFKDCFAVPWLDDGHAKLLVDLTQKFVTSGVLNLEDGFKVHQAGGSWATDGSLVSNTRIRKTVLTKLKNLDDMLMRKEHLKLKAHLKLPERRGGNREER